MLTIAQTLEQSAQANQIDGPDAAHEVCFTPYGVRIGLRVADSTLLKGLISRLPPQSKESSVQVVDYLYSVGRQSVSAESQVRPLNVVYCNQNRIAQTPDLEGALDAFESHVQLTIAEHAPTYVFVHAGVVAWKNRAILIPGTSHSGKTTLVEKLIRAGATYYSDEYAVLDRRGRVHPYARPLALRISDLGDRKKITPEEIGAAMGFKPLRVGLVVSTSYKPGGRWRPRKLTSGKGVLELLANTVSARSRTAFALTVLPKAIESAQILKSWRGEADEAVIAILRCAG